MKEITWKPGNPQETKNLLYFVLAIIVIYFVFTAGRSFLQKIGLMPSDKERDSERQAEKLDTASQREDTRATSGGWNPSNFNPWKEPFSKLAEYAAFKNSQQKEKGAKEYFTTGPYNPKHTTSQNSAKQINDAIGSFSDSPDKIVAVFNKLKDKSQVAVLKDAFNDRYSKNLYSFLDNKLDTQSQKKVWNEIRERVNKLPVGIYDNRNNNIIL